MLASIGWAVMGVQPNAQICVNVKVHQEAQAAYVRSFTKRRPMSAELFLLLCIS